MQSGKGLHHSADSSGRQHRDFLGNIPYSGKFLLLQTCALSPVSPPEEIFVVLIFAPFLC